MTDHSRFIGSRWFHVDLPRLIRTVIAVQKDDDGNERAILRPGDDRGIPIERLTEGRFWIRLDADPPVPELTLDSPLRAVQEALRGHVVTFFESRTFPVVSAPGLWADRPTHAVATREGVRVSVTAPTLLEAYIAIANALRKSGPSEPKT